MPCLSGNNDEDENDKVEHLLQFQLSINYMHAVAR